MCMRLAAWYGSGIESAVFNSLSSTKTGALVRLDGPRRGGRVRPSGGQVNLFSAACQLLSETFCGTVIYLWRRRKRRQDTTRPEYNEYSDGALMRANHDSRQSHLGYDHHDDVWGHVRTSSDRSGNVRYSFYRITGITGITWRERTKFLGKRLQTKMHCRPKEKVRNFLPKK